MSGQRQGVILVLAVVAGFVGGAISSRLFTARPVFAQAPGEAPKVISAQEFRLVDDQGKTRAMLEFLGSDPRLSLYDEQGKQRANLGLVEGNPWLRLDDERQEARVVLAFGFGIPVLALNDEQGKGRVSLRLAQEGPNLSLYDEKGIRRAALGSIDLEGIATGTEVKRPPSSLVLLNMEGKVIWKAPPD